MDTLNRNELEFLSRKREQFCVSIYFSTHRAGPEIRQDPIRLKNLVTEAETQLIAGGFRATRARDMLAPARDLTRRGGFWRHQEDGLALFVSAGSFQYFRLPFTFQEFVQVADRFEISPIMPLFTSGGAFYVLALSRNRVRCFHATPTPGAISELAISGVPRSMAEALKYDVRESQLQLHSAAAASVGGKEGAVFTGQGVGVDDEQARTLEFLLLVERGVRRALDHRAPLVLAGVTELLAVYRQINKYENLLDSGITGNLDRLKPNELHAAAWELARPYFETDRNRALARYGELAAAGRASNDLKEILTSAYQGRVDSAFLASGMQKWGEFDFAEAALELHDQRQPRDEDLLNVVAIQSVLHRGAVYMLPPQEIPGGSDIAATFRY